MQGRTRHTEADASVEEAHIAIGTRLRHARLTQNVTLRELAERIGCTESFLSKIEHDKARPSLATLHRLANSLNINIATLFTDDGELFDPVAITRSGERPKIITNSIGKGRGIILESLVSNAVTRLLEANIHHVEPNCSTDGMIQHEGEEMGFVLQGRIELSVEGQAYIVERGDSFFFRSSRPHGYKNIGNITALILWVNTPKSF